MIQRRRIRRFYSPLLPWVTLWAFAAVPAVLAQEAAPPQRVDSIVLTEQGSATVLRVLGTFDPERFGEIILDPLFGENTYSMEIPGAAASPDLPPSQSFTGNPRIVRIETSAVSFPDDPSLGLVTMAIELTPGTTARLESEGSGARELRVVLAGESAAAQPPAPQREAAPAQPAQAAPPPPTAVQAPPRPSESAAAAEPVAFEELPRTSAAPWKSRPTLVRIAVLNASGIGGQASRVAVMLMDFRRMSLERELGMRLEVVNISNAPAFESGETTLYYRPGFLRAALLIAKTLPGEQDVEPMRPESVERAGIDVEIWLGKDLP